MHFGVQRKVRTLKKTVGHTFEPFNYHEVFSCRVQSGFLDSFPFDPANLNSEVNQVKELKNGRLAMVGPPLSYLTSPCVHACGVLLDRRCFPSWQHSAWQCLQGVTSMQVYGHKQKSLVCTCG